MKKQKQHNKIDMQRSILSTNLVIENKPIEKVSSFGNNKALKNFEITN